MAFSIRSTPISTRQETCMVSYCSKSLRDFSMSSIETSAKRLRDFWKRLISKISASSCEWVMIFFIIFPIFRLIYFVLMIICAKCGGVNSFFTLNVGFGCGKVVYLLE